MLIDSELEFLAAFGFVRLTAARDGGRTSGLAAETQAAIADAYPGATGTVFVPAMTSRAPVSLRLVHDPLLLAVVVCVLGGQGVLKPAKVSRFAGRLGFAALGLGGRAGCAAAARPAAALRRRRRAPSVRCCR
ncbi:MAG: hypothetical protein ACRDZ4_01355 [Egibacteraceae bacterium]